MRFTLIKNVKDYSDQLFDLFKSLIGNNVKMNNAGDDLVFYYTYDNMQDINDVLNAIEVEFMVTIFAYNSYDSDEDRLNRELDIANELLGILPHGVYDIKKALILLPNVSDKTSILNFIIEQSSVSEEFIKGFVENDLNTSKASKNMFIHRNTMMYKLDKLNEISGFDLRSFKDAYILYSLIKNK